jgi:hypothetical protein
MLQGVMAKRRTEMSGTSNKVALVLAGIPEHDADLLYATGFSAPDPIVYVEAGRWRAIMVSSLEYGRALSGMPAARDYSGDTAGSGLGRAGTARNGMLGAGAAGRSWRTQRARFFPFPEWHIAET